MVDNQDEIESYRNKSFREAITAIRQHKIDSDRTFKQLIEEAIVLGHAEGISNDEIRKQILEAGVTYDTMLEYIPQSMKQEQHHVKSRPVLQQQREKKVGAPNLHTIGNDIPTESIISAADEPEPEPVLVHRTFRITMSPKKMIELGNAMLKMVKQEGLKTNYAIEYDYVDHALYVDITEAHENKKELMIKD
jgi:hypothetical protein